MTTTPNPAFSDDFDQMIATADGSQIYFGRDVLRGLIEGISDEVQHHRTHSSRWHWGTGVLGCAMWMDDPVLLDTLRKCDSVCVVVTKQSARKHSTTEYEALRRFADEAQGIEQEAFPELDELAPPQDGVPLIVGPATPRLSAYTPPIRELGFRKVGNRLVPIVHAKIALIGEMRWTDEHPSGYLVDELFFSPKRLWVGSANFTKSSRRSLEMGMWIKNQETLTAARKFLLRLIAASEPLDSSHSDMSPELVPVEYDDVAMLEYLRETAFDDNE